MRNKILKLEREFGTKLVVRKMKAIEKLTTAKDRAATEVIIIMAVLCLAIALLVFGKPLLEGLVTSFSNKAQTSVNTNF